MDPAVAARFQIAKMEGLLEVAVEQGAVMLSRQMRGMMNDMLVMGGNARARGFRLEGYGVFFDVEVPPVSQSVLWSYRVLERDSGGVHVALEALKNHLKTVSDPAQRRELDQAIRSLELQVTPMSASVLDRERRSGQTRSGERVAVQVAEPQEPASPPQPVSAAQDPNAAYTNQVKDAIVDTMLDYSQALTIGSDEFLTVAARADQARTFPGVDPYDPMTIVIRVRGRDLSDFRAGRISRDDALKRVEVREY